MTEERFLESPLWRATVAAKQGRDPHRHQRARLRNSYLGLRENIIPLLGELSRSTPDFTVHDISHVDALWETASVICGDAIELDPAEGYVLGCAFAFHDAAMGLAAYPDGIVEVMGQDAWRDLVADKLFETTGRWPDKTEIDNPPAEVYWTCVIQAVRQLHAQQAALLVEQTWRLSSGTDHYLIEETALREAYSQLIGRLAWSHWWDVDRLSSQFRHTQGSPPWLPADWTIDPLKLACILRLADATQLDSGRAPSFLFALRNPQGVSRKHWRFQEHMARPHLEGDRLVYTSMRSFERKDASAWWLAYDYLRKVDRELKNVDALLQDLGKQRLAARGIAYIDDPERFAEVFRVDGWRPIDANVQISDTPGYIEALGGEQLYGPRPEVAVRELIQNAQDAVVARQVLDPGFRDGDVIVSLEQRGESWILEVRDNGVGMDEDIIKRGLLDFGRSGWRTNTVRSKFVGLAPGGFHPAGRFGVGFYSVFMLGDEVTVTTRRYDLSHTDARRLHFNDGLSAQPLLGTLRPEEGHANHGTMVRVRLKTDPTAVGSLLARTTGIEMAGLVQQLVPGHQVPLTIKEWFGAQPRRLFPFDLDSAPPEEVFERLYPLHDRPTKSRTQWAELRDEFCSQATELVDDGGRRLGLAVLGRDLVLQNPEMKGAILLDGFRADEHDDFVGYMTGKPGRVSRDRVELACTTEQLRRWTTSQEARLRERNRFGQSQQLELSEILYRACGQLRDDHHIAMTSEGLATIGDIEKWAAGHDEIFFNYGWPCDWETRPPGLWHRPTGTAVTLPEGWLIPYLVTCFPFLDAALPRNRDINYDQHRHDDEGTWERRWWLASDLPEGLILKRLCDAWSCELEDLLAPVAKRYWDDYADLGIPGVAPAPVLHLHRP